MLMRLTDTSGIVYKAAHRAYRPEAFELISEAAASGKGVYGGLVLPEILVEATGDGGKPWIDEIGMGEAEYLPNLLRAAAYVLIACVTGMRDSEIQSLHGRSFGEQDGVAALFGKRFKARPPGGEEEYWWCPPILERCVDVLNELSQNNELFARAPRAGARETPGPFSAPDLIQRFIEFVNAEPSARPGRGAGLALEQIIVQPQQSVNATSLRRSYCVFASTRPGAIVGLGIQLGHFALRETTAYGSDGNERAVNRLNTEREQMVRQEVQRLIEPTLALEGNAAEELRAVRAHVIADPTRAEQLLGQVAKNYHLGLTNDCLYRPASAACGSDGPHLASHFCATAKCQNAVMHERHLPLLRAQIVRLDKILDRPHQHASFEQSFREQRVHLMAVIRSLEVEGGVE
jgi:hypothetical protein